MKALEILIGGFLGTALILTPINQSYAEVAKTQNNQQISQTEQISSLEQSIGGLEKKAKKNAIDYFNLTNLYEKNKEYNKSLEAYKDALDKGLKGKPYVWDERAKHINDRGIKYLQAGQHDKALPKFKSALKLDPDNQIILCNIGATYYSKKDYNEAIKYLKRAINIDKVNIDLYRTIGGLYIENKQYEEALLNLKKINFIDKKYKGNLFHIGKAYMGLEQYKKAADTFREYYSHKKNNKVVREQAKQLRKECLKLQKEQKYK